MFKSLTWNWLYNLNKEKKNEAVRIITTNKMSKNLFSTLYFSCLVTYGYFLLSKTEYFPAEMGGSYTNSLKDMWTDFPIPSNPAYHRQVTWYYLLSFGYHIKSLYTLIVENNLARRKDFIEMLIHHMCTILLYFMSYYVGMTKLGSLVMFIHDWADVTTSSIKFLV